MSNARSPREVCSTTIGMFGLISAPSGIVSGLRGRPALARRGPCAQQVGRTGWRERRKPDEPRASRRTAGGPELRLVRPRLVLARRPDRLARLREFLRDRLDLGRDA